jgi:transposase
MSKKPKEYIVQLTDEQNARLLSLVNKGEYNAHVIKRANVLLQSHQGKTAIEIANVFNTSQQTVYNIRKRFVKGGLDDALYDKPRPGAKRRSSSSKKHILWLLLAVTHLTVENAGLYVCWQTRQWN